MIELSKQQIAFLKRQKYFMPISPTIASMGSIIVCDIHACNDKKHKLYILTDDARIFTYPKGLTVIDDDELNKSIHHYIADSVECGDRVRIAAPGVYPEKIFEIVAISRTRKSFLLEDDYGCWSIVNSDQSPERTFLAAMFF